MVFSCKKANSLHFFVFPALSTVPSTVLKKYVRKKRMEEKAKGKGKGGVASAVSGPQVQV